jgi:hypothetical protein
MRLENNSLETVASQKDITDLVERCRKALEVSFGEIHMLKCFNKRQHRKLWKKKESL